VTPRVYTLYGCYCGTRWWKHDAELNPGHECPDDYPSGGMRLIELDASQKARMPEPAA
jgi:hypothetical protein